MGPYVGRRHGSGLGRGCAGLPGIDSDGPADTQREGGRDRAGPERWSASSIVRTIGHMSVSPRALLSPGIELFHLLTGRNRPWRSSGVELCTTLLPDCGSAGSFTCTDLVWSPPQPSIRCFHKVHHGKVHDLSTVTSGERYGSLVCGSGR